MIYKTLLFCFAAMTLLLIGGCGENDDVAKGFNINPTVKEIKNIKKLQLAKVYVGFFQEDRFGKKTYRITKVRGCAFLGIDLAKMDAVSDKENKTLTITLPVPFVNGEKILQEDGETEVYDETFARSDGTKDERDFYFSNTVHKRAEKQIKDMVSSNKYVDIAKKQAEKVFGDIFSGLLSENWTLNFKWKDNK